MSRDRTLAPSRAVQWAALDAAVRAADMRSQLWIIQGAPGSGRTTLLETAAREWRACGALMLGVSVGDYTTGVAGQLLTALRELIERRTEPELLAAVAALGRLVAEEPRSLALAVVHELCRAIGALARKDRLVLLIDDVDQLGSVSRGGLCLLAEQVRAEGATVLVTTGQNPQPLPCSLLSPADGLLTLLDLSESDIRVVLNQWVALLSRHGGGVAVDDALVTELAAALGPLAGNPGTLLGTVEQLDRRGRLVVVDGHLCLRRRDEPIDLPDGHPLIRTVRTVDPVAESVATAVATVCDLRVDDLVPAAWAARCAPESFGRALDRLVQAGVVRTTPSERLRIGVPALATWLRMRGGLKWNVGFPTRLVSQSARHGGANQIVDRSALTDQLGRAPHVRDLELDVNVLLEAADRATANDPDQATTRYRAALDRMAVDDVRRPRVVLSLLHHQLMSGRFDGVVVIAATERAVNPDPVLAVELALGEFVALVHEQRERDLSPTLFEALALACGSSARELCDALSRQDFAAATVAFDALAIAAGELSISRSLIELARALLTFRAFFDGHTAFETALRRWERGAGKVLDEATVAVVRDSAGRFDQATVLESLLGAEACPAGGHTAYYRRVQQAYRAGDWDHALALARHAEVEVSHILSVPALDLTRALAAEICVKRGHVDRGLAWLADVDPNGVAGPFVSWVRCGVNYDKGPTGEIVSWGWQEYQRHRVENRLLGLDRLLYRLAAYAFLLRDRAMCERLAREGIWMHNRMDTTDTEAVMLYARGVARLDSDDVRSSLAVDREHGDVYRQIYSALVLGVLRAGSGESVGLLTEALLKLKELGMSEEHSKVEGVLRALGVTAPRARNARDTFTSTENRIMDLVCDGMTNRRIAALVGLSEKTVERHLTRLFARTGCRSRVELATARLQGTVAEAV